MKKTVTALSLILALAAGSAFAAETQPNVAPAGDEHHGGMFKKVDTNGDGAIGKDEWVAKGDKMFGDIDANKDSKISPDEMKAHREQKRAEWKERREERKAKLGEKLEEHKAKIEERKGKIDEKLEQLNKKPVGTAPAAAAPVATPAPAAPATTH